MFVVIRRFTRKSTTMKRMIFQQAVIKSILRNLEFKNNILKPFLKIIKVKLFLNNLDPEILNQAIKTSKYIWIRSSLGQIDCKPYLFLSSRWNRYRQDWYVDNLVSGQDLQSWESTERANRAHLVGNTKLYRCRADNHGWSFRF